MSLAELADRATQFDAVAPFNEASRMAMTAGDDARVEVQITFGDQVVAAAFAAEDAPVELTVDPRFRRGGLGRRLLDDLLRGGETRFWAHGDLPPAQALAKRAGLRPARTLLVLRREDGAPEAPQAIDGATIRAFVENDIDDLLAVNARAFATHPEQGAMDRADFDRRRASDWFDPAGLFVAERGGRVVGFHWTKVEPSTNIGEVYVVGVDPDEAGRGLGTALTAHGLRHLVLDRGVTAIDLYVEADNAPALAVYARLGFAEHARDTLYIR